MSNQTLIPAFRCKVDTWQYYICRMKYAEAARQIKFPYEIGGNDDLGQVVQRASPPAPRGSPSTS